ncbi:MAG: aspartyl/asparaginyl beta-hydroxylase domain-containing protein [Vulcanimicrobiota bacterium]
MSWFEGKIRELGPVNCTELTAMVERTSKAVWTAQSFRQDHYAVHHQTRSLIFRFLTGDGLEGVDQPPWLAWKSLVEPVIAQAVESYGYRQGRCARIMLANLPAGSSISPHRDVGESFARTHRLHVPLLTHPEVCFELDGEPFHLAQGHAYEINNLLSHGVTNPGPGDRVHLIFDYYEAYEQT